MQLNEALTVFGLLAIAITSMHWLPSDSKDIVLSVVSGLLGYLTGRHIDGQGQKESQGQEGQTPGGQER